MRHERLHCASTNGQNDKTKEIFDMYSISIAQLAEWGLERKFPDHLDRVWSQNTGNKNPMTAALTIRTKGYQFITIVPMFWAVIALFIVWVEMFEIEVDLLAIGVYVGGLIATVVLINHFMCTSNWQDRKPAEAFIADLEKLITQKDKQLRGSSYLQDVILKLSRAEREEYVKVILDEEAKVGTYETLSAKIVSFERLGLAPSNKATFFNQLQNRNKF